MRGLSHFIRDQDRCPEYEAALTALKALRHSGDHRTFEAAVTALQTLRACEHKGGPGQAFAEAEQVHRVIEFSEPRNSWPTRGYSQSFGHACLARLAGKRCRQARRRLYQTEEEVDAIEEASPPCVPPGADHSSLWLEPYRKPSLFLTEPYELSLDNAAAMAVLARNWNLRGWISTWPGLHYPGRCLSVSFVRATPQELGDDAT